VQTDNGHDSPGNTPPSGPVKRFKLSRHQDRALLLPFVCHVSEGPWMALLSEQTSCKDSVPVQFDLVLQGVPEPVLISWFGSFDDAPPELGDLDNLGQAGPAQCTCCAGFTFCDGDCVPLDQLPQFCLPVLPD
jgi:hypothetical protein